MKRWNQPIVILYLLIIIYIALVEIVYVNQFPVNISWLLTPVCWLVIWGLSLQFKTTKSRGRGSGDKLRVVLIIVIIYIIIYFNLGLITDFENSPYNHTILGILQNIWYFIIVILYKEYVRFILLGRSGGRKLLYLIITVIFILTDLNFYQIPNHFIDFLTTFKYITATLIPTIARGILLTYLVLIGGYLLSYMYLIPLTLINILLPIFPKLNWFFGSILELLLITVTFLVLNYHQFKNQPRISRRRIKKERPVTIFILVIIMIPVVGFIVGLFQMMPIAIMSNSMAPLITRGDIVIVNKVTPNTIDEIKENDIIEYIVDKESIIHRVVDIERRKGGLLFTTKGDNNDYPDRLKVDASKVRSVVVFKIPKMGYPVVWLQELIPKK